MARQVFATAASCPPARRWVNPPHAFGHTALASYHQRSRRAGSANGGERPERRSRGRCRGGRILRPCLPHVRSYTVPECDKLRHALRECWPCEPSRACQGRAAGNTGLAALEHQSSNPRQPGSFPTPQCPASAGDLNGQLQAEATPGRTQSPCPPGDCVVKPPAKFPPCHGRSRCSGRTADHKPGSGSSTRKMSGQVPSACRAENGGWANLTVPSGQYGSSRMVSCARVARMVSSISSSLAGFLMTRVSPSDWQQFASVTLPSHRVGLHQTRVGVTARPRMDPQLVPRPGFHHPGVPSPRSPALPHSPRRRDCL